MRNAVYSRTFHNQLRDLLDAGLPHFGATLIAEKRDRVRHTIERLLTTHPNIKRPHTTLGLAVYPITGTPFVVLYDFDDGELRAHFIFHKHANLCDLDPASAEW